MEYTQEDLDNGILSVDMNRYNNDEAFRIEIGRIFCPDKLRVWMVEYDDKNNSISYTNLSYLATVQKMLDRGIVIATKQEYLRVEEFLLSTLNAREQVPENEKLCLKNY
jgi:hypothetical protein